MNFRQGVDLITSIRQSAVGLGLAPFASGVAGAVVAVGATVSVFYGFPPERRGFAIGMRQMSVALGGLLAAAGVQANLVQDAHLAALALEHGLILCSTDGDFARFPGLHWENPLLIAAEG